MAVATMTADDFLTGLLSGLALRSWTELDVSDRRFDRALAAVYQTLLTISEASDLDIDFQISPDPIHGDSSVIQAALSVAVQGRVVGRINPSFRRLHIKLDRERANRLIDRLPGGPSLYNRLTEEFLAQLDGRAFV
jgi:hypothetical protein